MEETSWSGRSSVEPNIKCDEKKPACLRCTSTGRTCDGYDKAALSRYRTPDPNQTAELARAEFVRACEWNEALRSMRRIEADIDGTETEKRLFSRFRAATVDSVAVHLCHFTAFWRRLNPSTGCQEEAIKHAVVALAGAYQLFQHPDEPVLDGFAREDLDIFVIQQYNKSIEHLQRHAGSSCSESMRVTLVCCLAFISLETLRGNHDVAVTHLVNGLRILQSLADSTFDCLSDSSSFVWPPPARDSLYMSDIIQIFARIELSTCFFTHGIQPVISERGYRARHFDDGASETAFRDVAHIRRAMVLFQHDTMSRLHEIATITAADANTPELFNLYVDLLYFRCAQFLLGLVAPTTSPYATTSLDPFSFQFQQTYLQTPIAPMPPTTVRSIERWQTLTPAC
ncbi:hypothetical protein N0V88_003186 [Collariella sp. IMI 366227]|nr:hypothetical protein N0V88_003186 [Collariella sp. IMI 366227]